MLNSEEGQLNAVFACFGSAAQHAQHLEAALGEFLLVYNKLTKQHLSFRDLNLLDQKLRKQTLGALLREFQKFVTIKSTSVEDFLEAALEKRNFLMHHFFREREQKLAQEQTRMELLQELTTIDSLLEQAAGLVGGMRVAVSEVISGTRAKSEGKPLFAMEVKLP